MYSDDRRQSRRPRGSNLSLPEQFDKAINARNTLDKWLKNISEELSSEELPKFLAWLRQIEIFLHTGKLGILQTLDNIEGLRANDDQEI